jgi:hypothetical protein
MAAVPLVQVAGHLPRYGLRTAVQKLNARTVSENRRHVIANPVFQQMEKKSAPTKARQVDTCVA